MEIHPDTYITALNVVLIDYVNRSVCTFPLPELTILNLESVDKYDFSNILS